jgi:hypothetical protein
MTTLNGGELAANAARALERYKAQERELEDQALALNVHLQLVKEFIAALTAAPRPSRKPRGNAEAALDGIVASPPDMEVAG